MRAVDILLYLNWLLAVCESSPQHPRTLHQSQHILHVYVLYLEFDKLESSLNKRRFWVRPIFMVNRRRAQGASDNLIFEMEAHDEEQYLKYLRMNKQMFTKLLRKVKPYIEKKMCSSRTYLCTHKITYLLEISCVGRLYGVNCLPVSG